VVIGLRDTPNITSSKVPSTGRSQQRAGLEDDPEKSTTFMNE
jgi:hypothetical protein